MEPQNIYDNPDFLAGYAGLDRQVRGLDGAAEWPALRSMVPDVSGDAVVDLGCGFGWFSRWAADRGASSVLGVDVSSKMLERAERDTDSALVEYRRVDLDELELDPGTVDLAFSSLTLHYVHNLRRLTSTVAAALRPGGVFVFSVEHPIYSAPSIQAFETSDNGNRIWPLDNYLVEGERITTWFVDGVRKQHRTVATYVNTLLDAGLVFERIQEWGPSPAQIEANPALASDLHRPWFLLLRASKPPG